MRKKNLKKWNLKSTKKFHKLTSDQQLRETGLPESHESGKFFSRCTKYNAMQYLLLFGIPGWLSRSKIRGAIFIFKSSSSQIAYLSKLLPLSSTVYTKNSGLELVQQLIFVVMRRVRHIGDISFRYSQYFRVKCKVLYATCGE